MVDRLVGARVMGRTKGGDRFEGTVRWSKGADIASAATLTLGTDGNYFDVTGTTTVPAVSAKDEAGCCSDGQARRAGLRKAEGSSKAVW